MATIRLDVGGHQYKVSQSMLELYPDTMLARLISKEWNGNTSESDSGGDSDDVGDSDTHNVIFIDRDGARFRYVLDFMRDHEVNLPMTESIEAMKKELEYHGLMGGNDENGSSSKHSITVGTPVEAGRLMAIMGGNMREELDGLDEEFQFHQKKIEDCSYKKQAVSIARSLFERSVSQFSNEIECGDEFTINIVQDQERNDCRRAIRNVKEFLREKLATYGLLLVTWKTPNLLLSDGECTLTLKSTKKLGRSRKREREKKKRNEPSGNSGDFLHPVLKLR
jgi:hypothetical protein